MQNTIKPNKTKHTKTHSYTKNFWLYERTHKTLDTYSNTYIHLYNHYKRGKTEKQNAIAVGGALGGGPSRRVLAPKKASSASLGTP